MLLADLLEQEKQEQQQQQPLPTGTSAPTNLPPGAQPIPSLQQQPEQKQPVPTDPSMVTMNPSMVTGQIVPNQQVGGMRPQLQTIQPQRPPSGATPVQAFLPRNAPPGAFPGAQVPPSQQQRMANPTLRQAGPNQQSWPQRHPQEVTLQQRGPGNSPVPQGSMIPMQIPSQQQPQIPGALATGPQLGAPQQPQSGVVAGTSTPPPPLSNTPAPPTPPENPQTDEDRLKVKAPGFQKRTSGFANNYVENSIP